MDAAKVPLRIQPLYKRLFVGHHLTNPCHPFLGLRESAPLDTDGQAHMGVHKRRPIQPLSAP